MPPKSLKTYAIPDKFIKLLKEKAPPRLVIPSGSAGTSGTTPPAARRPILWARSRRWESYSLTPCPLQATAYNEGTNTFGTDTQAIILKNNSDQFMITGEVSLALLDANLPEAEVEEHAPSDWGSIFEGGVYVQSQSGSLHGVLGERSPRLNAAHSNPPEMFLTFTRCFEAWYDNEELKLYAYAGFNHPPDHPVKLWSRLEWMQIIKL